MKKILTAFLIISIPFFNSCSKTPKHSIRIKNNYTETLTNVTINSVSYGLVEIGTTTDYKQVENDAVNITATSRKGIHFEHNDGLSGSSFKKWTVEFDGTGIISVHEN